MLKEHEEYKILSLKDNADTSDNRKENKHGNNLQAGF